jgi:DNA-directed RNA polymerase specialized sigma24 family protein
MSGDLTLAGLLARWFSAGDQLAHRRAYEWLTAGLYAQREVIDALGAGAVDEIRQEVLVRLLDRDTGKLRDAKSPLAYARTAWRRDLGTELKKWDVRNALETDVRDHIRQTAPAPGVEGVEAHLDAERALRIAESLPGKGRLAVLLTTRPDLISNDEWAALVEDLPPPPPARPWIALERDEASLLLYPPSGAETTSQRYQRLQTFATTLKRACAAIHDALEVEK